MMTLTPTSYFRVGVENKKKLNLRAALDSAKLTPNDQVAYAFSDIESALTKYNQGKRIYISCMDKNGTHAYLREVFFCLDSLGKKFKECPLSNDFRDCIKPLDPKQPTKPRQPKAIFIME